MNRVIRTLHNNSINRLILLIVGLCISAAYGHAQEAILQTDSTVVIIQDTIPTEKAFPEVNKPEEDILPESTIQEAYQIADSVFQPQNPVLAGSLGKREFRPNSTKAVLYSAIFPGLGQIYNQKYWKLPFVYGGFMGLMYAVTWNNRMYQDYQNAYKDIMDDYQNRPDADPSQWHDSWKDFLSNTNYETYISNTTFHNQLKRRKDYFRRYRDLSIILTAGFYAICMIDAYVDAELFNFDISPDLTMRIEPMVNPKTAYSSYTFGLSCCITF